MPFSITGWWWFTDQHVLKVMWRKSGQEQSRSCNWYKNQSMCYWLASSRSIHLCLLLLQASNKNFTNLDNASKQQNQTIPICSQQFKQSCNMLLLRDLTYIYIYIWPVQVQMQQLADLWHSYLVPAYSSQQYSNKNQWIVACCLEWFASLDVGLN